MCRNNFLDELRYLEVEIDEWSEIDTSNLAGISNTVRVVDQLGALLFEYCQIRLQAPTRSEEDARLAKRSELEPQILSLVDQVNHQISGEWDPDDDPAPPEDETIGHSSDDDRESDSDAVMADPDLAAGTRADGAVSVNRNDVTEELDSNYAALQAEHVALQNTHEKMATERQDFERQVRELQLDRQSLRKNEDDLRRKLYESKENYRALQSSYVAIRRSEAGPIQSPGA